MDEIVKAALRRWPDVPHCHGWLALDARGDWYMRDDAVQRAGPFPQVKGSRITHDKLRQFIARNYQADAEGGWYFQNGPQRVYVQLQDTPWIWRLLPAADGSAAAPPVQAHTEVPAGAVRCSWLDESGRLYLHTELGLGLVHSLDMLAAAEALSAGHWPQPQPVQHDALPQLGGFVRQPLATTA